MVKKMIKYSKFVLCIALILSLVAPSYAALSASDGSAFVTKAEFDTALADFNARLTTFEAGINSKIDSQVTSYLDRNGIWNGTDVVFDNKWRKTDAVSSFYVRSWAFRPVTTEDSIIVHAHDPWLNAAEVVVPDIPKSGLMNVALYCWSVNCNGWYTAAAGGANLSSGPFDGTKYSESDLYYAPTFYYGFITDNLTTPVSIDRSTDMGVSTVLVQQPLSTHSYKLSGKGSSVTVDKYLNYTTQYFGANPLNEQLYFFVNRGDRLTIGFWVGSGSPRYHNMAWFPIPWLYGASSADVNSVKSPVVCINNMKIY